MIEHQSIPENVSVQSSIKDLPSASNIISYQPVIDQPLFENERVNDSCFPTLKTFRISLQMLLIHQLLRDILKFNKETNDSVLETFTSSNNQHLSLIHTPKSSKCSKSSC